LFSAFVVDFIFIIPPYLFGGDGAGPKAVIGCWYITLSIKGLDSAFFSLLVLLGPSLVDYVIGEMVFSLFFLLDLVYSGEYDEATLLVFPLEYLFS
jgi:hypothetical protein